MNKPDWKDAPKWAKWLAQDAPGEWYWHEEIPKDGDQDWISHKRYDIAAFKLDSANPNWRATLEAKP